MEPTNTALLWGALFVHGNFVSYYGSLQLTLFQHPSFCEHCQYEILRENSLWTRNEMKTNRWTFLPLGTCFGQNHPEKNGTTNTPRTGNGFNFMNVPQKVKIYPLKMWLMILIVYAVEILRYITSWWRHQKCIKNTFTDVYISVSCHNETSIRESRLRRKSNISSLAQIHGWDWTTVEAGSIKCRASWDSLQWTDGTTVSGQTEVKKTISRRTREDCFTVCSCKSINKNITWPLNSHAMHQQVLRNLKTPWKFHWVSIRKN